MTSEENALVKAQIVRPLVTPDQAAKDWTLFEALKEKLLREDDYQEIAGKRYIKRSGFRKIAVYFGLSDCILEQERNDSDDRSFTWRIVVEVTAPNGRTCAGVGICDSRERKFAHVEHDVYATAHTRAKSRAISDMVAGGAVSAEELETGQEEYKQVPVTKKKPLTKPKLRPGRVDLGVIEYNLKALGLGEKDVLVSEEADGFIVEPVRDLDEEEHCRISGTLESMGAVWQDVDYRGRWKIPRSS